MSRSRAYRDLHVVGLWAFGNVHYLKGTLPILLLFAVALALRLAAGPARATAAAAAAVAIVVAFGWRASLVPSGATMPPASDASTVVLPSLHGLSSAVVLRGGGWWSDTSWGAHTLTVDGRTFIPADDFRLYPRGADMLLVPLRTLPDGPGLLRLSGQVALDAGAPVVGARQKIAFAVPCLFGLAGKAVCRNESLR